MIELLSALNRIEKQIEGSCQVLIKTNSKLGITILVGWTDGSNYSVERVFTDDEIKSSMPTDILMERFIDEANYRRKNKIES